MMRFVIYRRLTNPIFSLSPVVYLGILGYTPARLPEANLFVGKVNKCDDDTSNLICLRRFFRV